VTRRHQLEQSLRALSLSGMLDTLDARLAQAHAGELGHVEFLEALCEDEVARRQQAALERRVRAARFERICTLEEFDFSYNPKTPTAVIRDLATLRFIEAGESIVLHGPVGVGKSHIAQALGHLACRHGHTVAFTKTSRLLSDLAGGRADRSWETRLRRWVRPAVLILDDFAMREFTTTQADDLYELVSDRAERSVVITANRQAQDWYSLFPTRSWPSPSSTVSSTGPTTSTWTARATDPSNGRGPAPSERRDDRHLRRRGLHQPGGPPATARPSADLLLAGMPTVATSARSRHRGRPRRRRSRWPRCRTTVDRPVAPRSTRRGLG
jgi:DNA replication protein DnaC